MGYRSDVVIALQRHFLARNLVTNELPSFLLEHPHQIINGAAYWNIEQIKWYEEFEDIKEVITYFRTLDAVATPSPYGAVRIGENIDDIEEFGEPHEFGIYVERYIDSPWRQKEHASHYL